MKNIHYIVAIMAIFLCIKGILSTLMVLPLLSVLILSIFWLSRGSSASHTVKIPLLQPLPAYKAPNIPKYDTPVKRQVDSVVSLVLGDFVESWYARMYKSQSSQKPPFIRLVHVTLMDLVSCDVDLANIVVVKMLPVVNKWLGRPSTAIRNPQERLRAMAAKVIDKLNHQPVVVKTVCGEIILNCVLEPCFNKLSQPDFWNQQIIGASGTKVKNRIRIALALHIASQEELEQLLTMVLTGTDDSVASLKYKLRRIVTEDEDERKRLKIAQAAIEKRLSGVNPLIDSVSLDQVLERGPKLDVFVEYMIKTQRQNLIHFWLDVDSIKDPLETPTNVLARDDDVLQIWDCYVSYLDPRQELQDSMEAYRVDSTCYLEARRALLMLQQDVFRLMEPDFEKFRNDPAFGKVIATLEVPEERPVANSTGSEELGVEIQTQGDLSSAMNEVLNPIASSADLFGNPHKSTLFEEDLFEEDDAQYDVSLGQLDVLNQLILKAELTNNKSQLQVLNESRDTLQQEIEFKNMLRKHSPELLSGKTKVQITSFHTEYDIHQHGYTVYVVHVEAMISWDISRRYNEFYQLHEYLKEMYPHISVPFPARHRLMVARDTVIQERVRKFTQYLQDLVRIPEICMDLNFRRFLSDDQPFTSSVISLGDEESILSESDSLLLESPQPFIKPICDLFVNMFALDKSWLRGRAIMVILQQLLGNTIERYLKESLGDKKIVSALESFKAMFWPQGKFVKPNGQPTQVSSEQLKIDSKACLDRMMLDISGRIVGATSAKIASNKIHSMIQHDMDGLVLDLLDVFIDELF